MSDDDNIGSGTDSSSARTESDTPLEGGQGIGLTTGEPNSFEPEEDPESADS